MDILAVRSDSIGDVLLTEPALRALAGLGDVTLLCSPAGAAAAPLIGSVRDTIVHDCPWIVADPPPVSRGSTALLLDAVTSRPFRLAVVFTSQRQSPLPMALLLRLAGVPTIAARSDHYPGSLLDIRLRHDPVCHEVERNLELVDAVGARAPADRRMRVRRRGASPVRLPSGAVVVHPGATAPARTLDVTTWRAVVGALAASGRPVVLTGSSRDRVAQALRAESGVALDLVGATTLGELANVIADADAICVGNTGPMHLAAAVGTPVAAVFPATVPLERWRPWMVDHVVLGDQSVSCAPCHLRECPLPDRACLPVTAADVVSAVDLLVARRDAAVGVSAVDLLVARRDAAPPAGVAAAESAV